MRVPQRHGRSTAAVPYRDIVTSHYHIGLSQARRPTGVLATLRNMSLWEERGREMIDTIHECLRAEHAAVPSVCTV